MLTKTLMWENAGHANNVLRLHFKVKFSEIDWFTVYNLTIETACREMFRPSCYTISLVSFITVILTNKIARLNFDCFTVYNLAIKTVCHQMFHRSCNTISLVIFSGLTSKND